MPAPEIVGNEIRVRVKNPDLFVPSSFRTIELDKSKGIRAIVGKLKSNPEGGMQVQAYRFDKDKWTVEEAGAWVKAHESKSIVDIIGLYKEIDISGRTDTKVVKYIRAKILAVDEKNKIVKAVVSTEAIDRDKEINLISSWANNIKSYENHAVLLSSHCYNSLQNQIGQAVNVTIDTTNKQLVMDFKYYADEGNAEADWGYNLARKGMAMYSVGYIPVKALEGDAIPEAYRGLNPRRVYSENELLEVSQVVVGSNRGALQMGIDAPTVEQCAYAFEVIKTFGAGIPDFDALPIAKQTVPEEDAKPAGAPPADDKPPVVEAPVTPPAGAVAPEAKKEEDIIIAPVDVKSMKELQTILEIHKSGRIISTKNRGIIENCVSALQKTIVALNGLLEMTNPPEEAPADEMDEEKAILELIKKKY